MIGLPPSDSGGDQEMEISFLSTLVTSGFSGASGTSGSGKKNMFYSMNRLNALITTYYKEKFDANQLRM